MTVENQPRSPENGQFITITNREIWMKLNEIEDKVDEAVRQDLPKRVRSLELRFYGILAGVIGMFGTAIYVVTQRGG